MLGPEARVVEMPHVGLEVVRSVDHVYQRVFLHVVLRLIPQDRQ